MIKRLAIGFLFTLVASAALAQNPGLIYSGVSPTANDCVKFINRTLVTTTGAACSTGATFANPTASVGLTAVNGVATTAMRSDAAPALDQTAAYAFTGLGATTINQVAANAINLTVTGAAQTTANLTTVPTVSINTTWNVGGGNSASPALTANVTNTSGSTSSNIFNFQAATVSQLRLTFGGNLIGTNDWTTAGSLISGATQQHTWTGRGILTSPGAGVIQLGATSAASPVAQTLQAQGSRPGTDSNIGGAGLTITSGNGTGIGTLSTLTLQTPIAVASGTGVQTQTTGWRINNGTAASTGYTVATLPTVSLTGARAHVTDQLTTCAAVGAALLGVGAVVCPVFYNGTAWVGG